MLEDGGGPPLDASDQPPARSRAPPGPAPGARGAVAGARWRLSRPMRAPRPETFGGGGGVENRWHTKTFIGKSRSPRNICTRDGRPTGVGGYMRRADWVDSQNPTACRGGSTATAAPWGPLPRASTRCLLRRGLISLTLISPGRAVATPLYHTCPDPISCRPALSERGGPDLAGKEGSRAEAATSYVKLRGLWKCQTSYRRTPVGTVGVCGLMADGLS